MRFFERSYIVKWVIFFASFCWLWDFLLENQKLTKNSGNVHWNVWTNIKSCILETKIIFPKKKKRIPNMRFWNIHILVQISFFRGLLHCILVKFFFVRQLWWLTFLFSDGIFTVTSQLEITIIGSRHDFSKKKNPLFFDVNLKTIHQEEIFVNSLVYHTKEPLKWGTLSSCFSYNIWIKTNESVTFERPAMLISCYVAKKNKNEIQ